MRVCRTARGCQSWFNLYSNTRKEKQGDPFYGWESQGSAGLSDLLMTLSSKAIEWKLRDVARFASHVAAASWRSQMLDYIYIMTGRSTPPAQPKEPRLEMVSTSQRPPVSQRKLIRTTPAPKFKLCPLLAATELSWGTGTCGYLLSLRLVIKVIRVHHSLQKK